VARILRTPLAMKLPNIAVDFQVFLADGAQAVGTVRRVTPSGRPEVDIYVENAGDFVVPLTAVTAVHANKVIVDVKKLDQGLRLAIGHAHDAEAPTISSAR
jgi:hypothetical protein